jgi:hypothetical protein
MRRASSGRGWPLWKPPGYRRWATCGGGQTKDRMNRLLPARRARGINVETPHNVETSHRAETSHVWRVFYFHRTKSFHVNSPRDAEGRQPEPVHPRILQQFRPMMSGHSLSPVAPGRQTRDIRSLYLYIIDCPDDHGRLGTHAALSLLGRYRTGVSDGRRRAASGVYPRRPWPGGRISRGPRRP